MKDNFQIHRKASLESRLLTASMDQHEGEYAPFKRQRWDVVDTHHRWLYPQGGVNAMVHIQALAEIKSAMDAKITAAHTRTHGNTLHNLYRGLVVRGGSSLIFRQHNGLNRMQQVTFSKAEHFHQRAGLAKAHRDGRV